VAIDAAANTSAAATASLTVTARVVTGPANDNFVSATNLVGTYGSITATNVGATKEPGEVNIAGNAGGKSIWFTWTASVSRRVTLTTAGSNFDTLLGVYRGSSLSTLTAVATNDDASYFTTTSALSFNAVAGTTYHFVIDGYIGASGNIVLNMS
jgi:hypothetical protein